VGTAYSETLQATGGTGTLTWTVVLGSLPANLSLSSSGTISGTPSATGTSTFTVKVTDSAPTPVSAQQQLSITINPIPLKITTTTLPNGVVGTAYSATLQSTGGTGAITWSVSVGTLPSALSLNAATGAITGTPTTAGTSNFTVTATDSGTPPQVVNQALSITINPLLAITTTSLANGVVNTAYSASLQATGGVAPITWSVTSGTLPPALTLSSSGAISGTPTTAGTSNFTVTATDSGTPQQSKSQPLSITINPLLSITTTSLPNGTVNSIYSATLQSSGGVAPITWSYSGTLPAGLTLSSSGVFSGTPTASGTFSFTVTATDSGTPQQAKSQQLSITINPVLSITTTSLPAGTVGTAYNQSINTNGGTPPITWSVTSGALPPGLTLSASGAISGTATAYGSYVFTVTATDSSNPTQSVSQQLTIVINNVPLSITTTSLPNGVVGVSYSASVVASGGTTPYTWSLTAGTLPAGLTLNTSTGAITGTPTTVGTSSFTVTVTDSTTPTPQTQSQPLSISIVSVLAITTTSLPNGSVGTTYSQPLAATGGTSPYTWRLISGALPAGLSLSSSGVISGTPTAAGTATFTVKVTDSTTPTPQSASQPLSTTVNGASGGALTITTTSLPAGVLSVAYTSTVAVSGGIPPYSWSVTSGSLPAGLTLNTSTGVISGTPTTAATSAFTVTVTDSSTPTPLTQSRALSITINTAVAACSSSGNEAVLSGPYAFTLSGFNAATGFLAVAGAFTADGSGNITAGEADTNGAFGAQSSSIITSASSYSVGPDNRGCATIATSFGTFTTRFALGSLSSGVAAKGRMIEFDPPTSSAYIAVGQILQQTASSFSSGPSGSYVYGLVGWDPSIPARLSVVGVLTASSGALTNMNEDVDDGGTTYTDVTGITGTYTSFDTYGRATTTFSDGSTGTLYMVSASKLLYLQSSSTYLIGEIDQQTVPTGGFTDSSLNGLAVVYFGGIGSSGNDIVMGLFNANGSGSAPFKGEEDDSGTMTAESMTCTYTVASNGRTTLGSPCSGPVLYLAKTNTAFFLDMSTGVDFGEFTSQAAGPFTDASLSGTFFAGDLEVISQSQNVEVGSISLDGAGNVSGTTDSTSTTAQSYDAPLTDTYSINSDGTFTVGSEGSTIVGAVISSSKFILISHKKSAYASVMAFSQ
jgi:hypothetical protein